ncbi:MAG: S41 family peptidase [Chlamydiota bacterium]
MRKIFVTILTIFASFYCEAKLPELDNNDVKEKIEEITESHVKFRQPNSTLFRRALANYLEELDPTKSYFTEEDIQRWVNPSDELIDSMMRSYRQSSFPEFEAINDVMIKAITRRDQLEEKLANSELPAPTLLSRDLRQTNWPSNEEQLFERLLNFKALQRQAAEALPLEKRDRALERIEKMRLNSEEDFATADLSERKKLINTNIIKAFAAAFDSHTAYFTPGEATQFMIDVQHRLFGIGVQLRDNLNGFSIVKIIEGGPADKSQQLKPQDRIIAIDDEPVVGMDIYEVVELIRGEKNTPVDLTIVRVNSSEENSTQEETHEITLRRDEIVVQDSRLETSYEPFGDGVIACLKLHTFYQDPNDSSAEDIAEELKKLKKEHNPKGVILDLRYNSGGMLSQAIAVSGLFITQGVVVSIQDNTGDIQHLRDFSGTTAWDGPLVILTSRASASAAEIVSQTLQDYGRAIIVGDDHTFGKGTFQTFTLNTIDNEHVNPEGEYKVTRGMYYTASGKSPQLLGVQADVVVPGIFSQSEIGEKFSKYPLENDSIESNIEDKLTDLSTFQRKKLLRFYGYNLQPKLVGYTKFIDLLKKNSQQRIASNNNYQNFLTELSRQPDNEEEQEIEFGQNDLQLIEAFNITKDLIILTR